MDLKDKVVWITGASSGIGAELAVQTAQKGARVILSSRNREQLETVRDSAGLNAKNSLVHPLDVSNYKNFNEDVNIVLDHFGRVDILINNAGVTQRETAASTDISVDERLMKTNYFGTVALTKSILPHFLERGSGVIAVTSSVTGKFGTQLRTAYSASKHALHGFFESLRAEVDSQGIQVTIICPGFVDTRISHNALKGDGELYGKADEGQLSGMTAAACARRYIKAIEDGKEEAVIAQFRERFAVWLSRFHPPLLRRIIRRSKVT